MENSTLGTDSTSDGADYLYGNINRDNETGCVSGNGDSDQHGMGTTPSQTDPSQRGDGVDAMPSRSGLMKPHTAEIDTLSDDFSGLGLGPARKPTGDGPSGDAAVCTNELEEAQKISAPGGDSVVKRSSSILDPCLTFLHKDVANHMDSSMVKSVKCLLTGPITSHFTIPMAELEEIVTGYELISAVYKHLDYDYARCLDTLIEIFKTESQAVLVRRIKEEKETVERSPERYSNQRPRGKHVGTSSPKESHNGERTLYLLQDFPTGIPRLLTKELTKDKKVFLLDDGDIVYTHKGKTKDIDRLMFCIPQVVWERVLDQESEIQQRCQNYSADHPKMNISGSTFVDIGSYKGNNVVSLKVYYGSNLNPSHIGTTLIFKTWRTFVSFLHDAKKKLAATSIDQDEA